MGQIKRKEAREILFGLLFEREFKKSESAEAIFELSSENREIPENEYIRKAYFGICENARMLDRLIGSYANGWKANRLSGVSRTAIRISVYEMMFFKDIPVNVSVSEAVEISKKYGEDGSRAFVNGVLSSIAKDIGALGRDAFVVNAKEKFGEAWKPLTESKPESDNVKKDSYEA